ncbi:MAG: hypothetical protein DKT66_12550 [Candidatus Melainabacteria bacterium]|nr:MAG: hypothetical protein DKT66_12550 [Candidatus Melainabacteria bacterium]
MVERSGSSAAEFAEENLVKPIINSALIEPERAIASSFNKLTGTELLPVCDLIESKATDSTAAKAVRTVSSTVGMIVPYVVAGKLAAKPLGQIGNAFAAEGQVARIVTSPHAANILGAATYDAMRMPVDGETRFGNAASGTVAFGIFEAGNALAGRSPYGLLLRGAAGFAGGATAKAVHTELSEGKQQSTTDILTSGAGGAALNMVLPIGHRLFARAESEIAVRAKHSELAKFSAEATPAAETSSANRYLGWLSKETEGLSVGSKGRKIKEVPMHGDAETPAVDFTDFSRGQRVMLVDKMSKNAIAPLNNERAVSGLVAGLQLETQQWTKQPLKNLSTEIGQTIDDLTTGLHKSKGERTPQLAEMEQKLSAKVETFNQGLTRRAEDIENALNHWGETQNLPRVGLLIADTPGLQAQCLKGKGIIQIGPDGIIGDKMSPELVEKIVHEYSHVIQENQTIRRMMDERGVGMKLTESQRSGIKSNYKKQFGSEPTDEFLDQIASNRQGRKLSLSERLEARRNEASIANYLNEKPLIARPAIDGMLGQMQPVVSLLGEQNGIARLQSSLTNSRGPLFDVMAGRKSLNGLPLGNVEERLRNLGQMIKSGTAEEPAIQSELSAVTRDLQGFRQISYDQYMRHAFEKQAFASGYLARLYFEAAEQAAAKVGSTTSHINARRIP